MSTYIRVRNDRLGESKDSYGYASQLGERKSAVIDRDKKT